MKTAVVIFSRNAAGVPAFWQNVLESFAVQDLSCDLRLLVDSESEDSTVEIARKFRWEIRNVEAATFNHGLTRNKIAMELFEQGFDVAVFATQDAVPANSGTLSTLVDGLVKNSSAVAYARQLPRSEHGFDSYFRRRNYPEKSKLKSKDDIPELGLLTCFCSDTLAAWNLQSAAEAGGFPETSFGEDMLLGAKFILSGKTIYYCAESQCYHEHKSTLTGLFKRGIDIGTLHGTHPELKNNFGSIENCASGHIPLKQKIRFFLPLAIKYLGFIIGRLKHTGDR